jgi:hypothetical protein
MALPLCGAMVPYSVLNDGCGALMWLVVALMWR